MDGKMQITIFTFLVLLFAGWYCSVPFEKSIVAAIISCSTTYIFYDCVMGRKC